VRHSFLQQTGLQGDQTHELAVSLLCCLAIVVIILTAWHVNTNNQRLLIADVGFSGFSYAYQKILPENFKNDFPSGMAHFENSLVMRVYPWVFSLGFDPEKFFSWFMLGEHFFYAFALIVLTRTLRPRASPILTLFLIGTVFSTRIFFPNLARFPTPVFCGLYYQYADGFRILALSMALRNKWLAASMLLVLGTASHLLMGLTMALFLFPLIVERGKDRRNRRQVYLAVVLFLFGLGAWTFSTGIIAKATTDMPVAIQEWFLIAKINSYHWFPVYADVLTSYSSNNLWPLLSVLLFGIATLRYPDGDSPNDIKLLFPSGIILAFTVFGIIISALEFSPFLVKLALPRSTEILMPLSTIIIFDWALRSLHAPVIKLRFAGIATVLSPFLLATTFPILLSVLVTFVNTRSPSVWCSGKKLIKYIGFMIGISFLAYSLLEWTDFPVFFGFISRSKALIFIVCSMLIVGISMFYERKSSPNVMVSYSTVILLSTLSLMAIGRTLVPTESAEKLTAFREAQLWARNSTPKDAIFMVDPSLYYGWRDYSQRSSFGNYREWIFFPILYINDSNAFREGEKRLAAIGFDWRNYLQTEPPMRGYTEISKEIKAQYNTFSDTSILVLSKKFNIKYFVFDKSEFSYRIKMNPVFENTHYIIYDAGGV